MQKKILEERPFKENENILKNGKNCTLQMEKKGQKWPICTVKVRLKKNS